LAALFDRALQRFYEFLHLFKLGSCLCFCLDNVVPFLLQLVDCLVASDQFLALLKALVFSVEKLLG